MDVPVSIHAPHTEGDYAKGRVTPKTIVSIHAPHTEGDFRLLRCCCYV